MKHIVFLREIMHKIGPERKPAPITVFSQKESRPPLNSLDLFSGCGGLSLGLESSGFAQCKWAVEIDKTAAKTFSTNFPRCRVFNEDVGSWFERLQVKIF